MFPSGRFVTRDELSSGRLQEPPPPAVEVLDTQQGKTIRLASGLMFLVEKGERIEFDPTSWLVGWDGTMARTLSVSAGTWSARMPFAADAGSLIAGPKVIGDYFAAASLWHLPDLAKAASPDRTGKTGRTAIRWVATGSIAVALEGIPGGNGISDWALEIWKLGSKEESRVLPIDVRNDVDLALSRNGALLGLLHGDVELIETDTLKRRVLLGPGEVETGGRLSFSPDSSTLCARYDRGARAFAVGPRVTPAKLVEMPLSGDDCRSVAVPPPPTGRVFLMPFVDSTNGPYSGGALRAGDLVAVIDQTPPKSVSPTREFSVRLLRADGSVAADLPYLCDHATVAADLRLDDAGLVVGDVQHEASCGGRIDLGSLKWKARFGESQSREEKATQEAADRDSVKALVAALGPAPAGSEWFGPECSGRECWPIPSGGPQVNREFVGAATAPGASMVGSRFALPNSSSVPGASAVVEFYNGWFTVTRESDGRVLATVVQAGSGAVALLSGGAVETFGTITDGALVCRVGVELHPWPRCEERFSVRGALLSALRGREDYLQ